MSKLTYKNIKNLLPLFTLLANPLRLKIFRLLLEKELCVCELQMLLKAEQSRISHQLRLFRLSGLIEFSEEGRRSVYRVSHKWKNHPVVKAIKESILLDDTEREAIRKIVHQSLQSRPNNGA